ncbi:IS6 family transposase [Ktedonobacteria bacterium brp13]|nr:IS6 family transposase [Ktedonobacteria bacterium brp13]
MKTNIIAPTYKGFRFPPEIISHAVWLYFRFSLSFRDVEELLAQRGIVVTYETVRQWRLKFGQTYANELRRRRPRCGDKWHLDEVFLHAGALSEVGRDNREKNYGIALYCLCPLLSFFSFPQLLFRKALPSFP